MCLFPCQLLQDVQASEGQVVVLECRVRGSPPLQVRWFRQGEEILDSPDFRILQKSETLLSAHLFYLYLIMLIQAYNHFLFLFFPKSDLNPNQSLDLQRNRVCRKSRSPLFPPSSESVNLISQIINHICKLRFVTSLLSGSFFPLLRHSQSVSDHYHVLQQPLSVFGKV